MAVLNTVLTPDNPADRHGGRYEPKVSSQDRPKGAYLPVVRTGQPEDRQPLRASVQDHGQRSISVVLGYSPCAEHRDMRQQVTSLTAEREKMKRTELIKQASLKCIKHDRILAEYTGKED